MDEKHKELKGQKDILTIPLYAQGTFSPRSPISPNRSPIRSPLVDSLHFRKLSEENAAGFSLKHKKIENDVDE